MSYQIRTDVFEGPFELLVYLIRQSGLDIYAVSIAEITDQYMEYIRSGTGIPPDRTADFMVLAATLLQIKSQMLLPDRTAAAPEEEGSGGDPRDDLAERIAEYQRYKTAAGYLRDREEAGERVFVKPGEDVDFYRGVQEEELDVSLDQFIDAFQSFLEKRRRVRDVRQRYGTVERERMSMEERSGEILQLLESGAELTFDDLLPRESDLYDTVLTFVTLLELMAQQEIMVRQGEVFGRMKISRREADARG